MYIYVICTGICMYIGICMHACICIHVYVYVCMDKCYTRKTTSGTDSQNPPCFFETGSSTSLGFSD